MRTDDGLSTDRPAVIVVVDDDDGALADTEAQLRNRYGADYEIRAFTDPEAALTAIRALKDDGRQMALVLATLEMPAMPGLRFLDLADDVFPTTKRILLLSWEDRSARRPIFEAVAVGSIDCHLPKPTTSPDEAFHQVITEALAEWARSHTVHRPLVRVIGADGSPRCHEMRDLLERYSVPYMFLDAAASEGVAVLGELGVAGETKPVMALHDGRVLVDPTNREAADALGGAADLTDNAFDVVVVGAGPAGLASAVYATSEGLRTLVVEREAIGGQAGTTSRIRN
jgi:thioredoxin reductase (NADPH)